jgi:hypothetical protein
MIWTNKFIPLLFSLFMVSRLWALVFLYFMRQKLNHCGRFIIVTLSVHLQSVWKVRHVPENYKIRPEIRVMCHTGPVRIIIQLSAQLSHWTPARVSSVRWLVSEMRTGIWMGIRTCTVFPSIMHSIFMGWIKPRRLLWYGYEILPYS